MTILWKVHKPDNFELNNSWKFSFSNIQGSPSNLIGCEYFLESDSPDSLALSETNLEDSIDSSSFFVRGYISLIQKDFVTHLYGLEVYANEGIPFAGDMSFKNFEDSY